MAILNQTQIEILRTLCGQTEFRFFASELIVRWDQTALAMWFSVNRPYRNFSLPFVTFEVIEACHEDEYLRVYEAEGPKNVKYIEKNGIRMMDDPKINDIDFKRPYKTSWIDVMNFEAFDEDAAIGHDAALVFHFTDRRRIVLSAFESFMGMIELITDEDEIENLLRQGTVRLKIE